MSKTYDFMAAEHIDDEDVQRLRDVWAHLILLGSGQKPPMSNAEAADALATAFENIMGEQVQAATT